VLTGGDRFQEKAGDGARLSGAKKLIDFDENRLGNDEISSEIRYKRRGKAMRPISPIRRGNEGTRIGGDPQRASTSSRR
jgi:hypothetical protein